MFFIKKIPFILILFSLSHFALAKGELNLLIFGKLTPEHELKINGRKVKTFYDEYWEAFEPGNYTISLKIDGELQEVGFNIVHSEVTQVSLDFNAGLGIDKNLPLQEKGAELSKQARTHKLMGKVLDDQGEPLAKARVFVQTVGEQTRTDNKGNFSIMLPPGVHKVLFLHKDFRANNIDQLEVVKKEQRLSKPITMQKTGINLDDYIVLAPKKNGSFGALIQIRKKSTNVSDVIGAEQMSKSGDSDAASSLRRVTGLTLVGGRFVYVRGLGERYSSVLMNDLSVPSPDPTRKVVPLDIFPAGILESVIVQKSYTPDLPGEFGGGTIKLNTKSIPKKFEAKISISGDVDENVGDFNTYKGGSTDWLGMDDGRRALPKSIIDATKNGERLVEDQGVGGIPTADILKYTKDMQKDFTTYEGNNLTPPNISFYIGDKAHWGANKLGYFFSTMYSSNVRNLTRERFSYALESAETDKLVKQRSSEFQFSRHNIRLGGMFNLGFENPKFGKVTLTNSLLRKTTDSVQIADVVDTDDDYIATMIDWNERELRRSTIKTEHRFGVDKDIKIDLAYSYSEAIRYQPSQVNYRYNLVDGNYLLDTDGDNNSILFADLKDTARDMYAKFSTPVIKSKHHKVFVDFGGQATSKVRVSDGRRFRYEIQNDQISSANASNASSTNEADSLEDLCSDTNVDLERCKINENTKANDNYTARQQVYAQYIGVNYHLKSNWKFNVGMRNEVSYQKVSTFALNSAEANEVKSELEMMDQLPVYGVQYNLNKDNLLRFAYSETVSRPDFKELSLSPYFDDERDEMVEGNPELKGTVIRNYDIRWESYFTATEYFSVGAFFKEFINPIEDVYGAFRDGQLVPTDGDSATFANIESASTRGIEIEFNKKFPRFSRFSIGGNFAYIESEVEIGEANLATLTSESRPMQGQSPYTINTFIDYANKDSGTNGTLLFNVFGERISNVGIRGEPDVYELPVQQLDFVFSQKFGKNSSVRFKFKNLLDPEVIRMQGNEVKERFKRGRNFGVSYAQRF